MADQVRTKPDVVEDTDQDTNNPIVSSEDSTDQIPVYVAAQADTPVGLTAPVTGSLVVPTEKLGADGPVKVNVVEVDPQDKPMSGFTNIPLEEVHVYKANTHADATPPVALLDRVEADRLRMRWDEIQGKFVDEPRSAVQQADALVADAIEKIMTMFTSEHAALEGQWNQGKDVSTEELRKALQRYRSFFKRLVA